VAYLRSIAILTLALLACRRDERVAPQPPAASPPPPDAMPAGAPRTVVAVDRHVLTLAADDTSVYYALLDGDPAGDRADTIWRVGVDGGEPHELADTHAIVTAMAQGGDDLVVATVSPMRPLSDDDIGAEILVISTRDGSSRSLAHVRASQLAVGSAYVYYRNDRVVGRVPREGGPVEVLASNRRGRSLATIGEDLYFSEIGTRGGTLWRVRAGANTLEAVLEGPGCCGAVLTLDGVVYTEMIDVLFEVREDGPHAVAHMTEDPVTSAHDTIAVTTGALSWISKEGTVWGAPRGGGVAAVLWPGSPLGGGLGPTVASSAGSFFVTREDAIVRFDDRPLPTEPVEWLTLFDRDLGDARVDTALGSFFAAIQRGEIAVRFVGPDASIGEQARRIATAAGPRARITTDTTAPLPAVQLSARDMERFLTARRAADPAAH
jgi:hypothetical protein